MINACAARSEASANARRKVRNRAAPASPARARRNPELVPNCQSAEWMNLKRANEA